MSTFEPQCRYTSVPAPFDEATAISTDIARADGFDALFTTHYKALARVLFRVVGDTGRAEELAAEAFWKLHRNPPPASGNMLGWLHRTGLRLSLDDLRKSKRRARYEALVPAPAGTRNPEETLGQMERKDRVRGVLAVLKPEKAALLVLRSEGYRLAEIASLLGLNPQSVGTLLSRAELTFRKEYVKRYGEN